MKKLIASLVVVFSVLVALAQKEIVNDPNAELRSINGSFKNIKISGGIDLFLTQSDDEAIAVSASENKFKDGIKTLVVNNTLQIFYFGNNGGSNSKNKNLRVYVSFKNLESINASSACDIQVAGNINVPALTIDLSGSSDFRGVVNISDLKINLSGASDVMISGVAKNINIETSGASDVKGYNLVTDVCTAKASGASDINITVNKELNATASGASDIFYKGNCVIKEMHANGASSVSKKI